MALFGQVGNFFGEDPPRRAAWTHENETKIIMEETKGRGAQDPTGCLWTSQEVLKMPTVPPRAHKAQKGPLGPQRRQRRPWVPKGSLRVHVCVFL